MNYWKEGADAFDAGKDITACTYTEGSYPYRMWVDGWHDAWYEKNWKRAQ